MGIKSSRVTKEGYTKLGEIVAKQLGKKLDLVKMRGNKLGKKRSQFFLWNS